MLIVDLLIVLGLILLNGFFAMSELAFISSKPNRLKQMADAGSPGATRALRLIGDPTGFLSTVQIGITLIGIFAGAYSGATFAEPLAATLEPLFGSMRVAEPVSFAAVVIIITYLSLIVGELVPKQLALQHAERISSVVSAPMILAAKVGLPLVFLLRLSTNTVLRILGVSGVVSPRVTEDDIRSLILDGVETGVVKRTEQEMIEGVMHVVDRRVRAIMVPRREIVYLDLDWQHEENRTVITTCGHTRYPLCRGSVDDILGIVHVKDLIADVMPSFETIVRAPLYILDSMPVVRLIDTFKTSGSQMAIVIDEYGGVQGLITPTDVFIAIAGDFTLPDDAEEPEAVQREDGSWLLDATMSIINATRLLDGFRVEIDDDFETLAGYLLDRFSHIPRTGEIWSEYGWQFEVVDLDGLRIDKVMAVRDV